MDDDEYVALMALRGDVNSMTVVFGQDSKSSLVWSLCHCCRAQNGLNPIYRFESGMHYFTSNSGSLLIKHRVGDYYLPDEFQHRRTFNIYSEAGAAVLFVINGNWRNTTEAISFLSSWVQVAASASLDVGRAALILDESSYASTNSSLFQKAKEFASSHRMCFLHIRQRSDDGIEKVRHLMDSLALLPPTHRYREDRAHQLSALLILIWKKQNRHLANVKIPKDILNLLIHALSKHCVDDDSWGYPTENLREKEVESGTWCNTM